MQQHEVSAKARAVVTTIAMKREIMCGMLGTRNGFAMKKTADVDQSFIIF